MRRLVSIAFSATFFLAVSAYADQGGVRRPIDNFLGNWLDHTYTIYQNAGSWVCLNSFTVSTPHTNQGCNCAGQSDCTWLGYNSGWAYMNQSTAVSCGNWINANWTYGTHGVCHNSTSNENYYIAGHSCGYYGTVRGLSISENMFGVWGTNYSGCP